MTLAFSQRAGRRVELDDAKAGDVHVSREDGDARPFRFGEIQQTVQQPQLLGAMIVSVPLIVQVVFDVLPPGQNVERLLGEGQVRMDHRDTRHHQQVAQPVGGVERRKDNIPARWRQDLALRPLRAQVEDEQPELAEAEQGVETNLSGKRRPGRGLRIRMQLEQQEAATRCPEHRLQHVRRLLVVTIGTPAVEDVVVVPHHQRRDRRQQIGDRLWGEPPAVGLGVEGFESARQRRSGGCRLSFGTRPLVELGQFRNVAPQRVGVDLVAAQQQQVEGKARLLSGHASPRDVLVLGPAHVARNREAVARCIGDARVLPPPWEGDRPPRRLTGDDVRDRALRLLQGDGKVPGEHAHVARFSQRHRRRRRDAVGGQRAGCLVALVRNHDR